VYDPRTARWTTEDPIGFQARDGNLYRYVENDPTNATDPTGQYLVSSDPAAIAQLKKDLAAYGVTATEMKLPSGMTALITTVAGWEGLFKYANSRWPNVLDPKFKAKNPSAWAQEAQERTEFLLAAGAAGQDSWRTVTLRFGLVSGKIDFAAVSLLDKDTGLLNAVTFAPGAQRPVALDIGGRGGTPSTGGALSSTSTSGRTIPRVAT
jgi:uncharacterized protein RhaS with RHS repeats